MLSERINFFSSNEMVMPHSSTQVQCGARNYEIELLAIASPCLQLPVCGLHSKLGEDECLVQLQPLSTQSVL